MTQIANLRSPSEGFMEFVIIIDKQMMKVCWHHIVFGVFVCSPSLWAENYAQKLYLQ